MHESTDKDIERMLSQVRVPEPRADLAEHIITAAMAQEHGHHPRTVEVKTGGRFTAWWHGLGVQHGPKLALAASLAAVAVIVFNPVGQIAEHYAGERQMAEMQAAPYDQERYTVGGVPLLADISLMEEPDLELEELVVFAG